MSQQQSLKQPKISLLNQIKYRNYNIGNYNYSICKYIAHKRWMNISLNTSDSIEKINTSAITSINIENIAGRYMLTGYMDGLISVHDITDVTYPRSSTKFTADSAKLVTCASKMTTHTKSISDLQWYPYDTGMFTSSSSDGWLYVWDTSRMIVADKYKYSSNEKNFGVSCHSISSNNIVALSGDLSLVHLWSIRSGARTHCLKGHRDGVYCLDWCQDSEYLLVSGGNDGKVILWDVRKHTEILYELDKSNSRRNRESFAHNFAVVMVKFLPSTSELVTCGRDCIRVWDLRHFNEHRTIHQELKFGTFYPLKFDITKRHNEVTPFMFASSFCNVIMIDLNNGHVVKTLFGHHNRIYVCYVHPLEQLVCSGGMDNDVLFWSPLQSAKKPVRFDVPQSENIDIWSDSD